MSGPIRVLHVEEDPDSAESTADAIEREDDRFTVETATSANEGLERLAADDVDCVVSGYDLGGQAGVEFLDAVREDDPDLPFVLLASPEHEHVAPEALANGATDWCRKGDGGEREAVLAERIANAVEHHRRLRVAERRERRLTALLQGSTDWLCVLDEDGVYQFVSSPIEEVVGRSPDELIGEALSDYVHPEDRDRVGETIDRSIADPDETVEMEYRFRHREGSWHRVQTRARNRLDDPAIEGIVLNSRDVTDRNEDGRDLELYESMVETVPDGLYVMNDELRYVAVNEGMAELTGYSEDELVGSHTSMVVDDGVVEMAEENRRKLLESDEEFLTHEYDFLTADGERIHCENRFRVLPSDEEFRGTAGIIRDVTEREERERELKRKNERLQEFANIVSHDLRNPLNVASGRLELARMDCDNEHLDVVAQAHERMDALVEDILTLAREGARINEMDAVELRSVVDDCWRIIETSTATLLAEVDGEIRADPGRLQQLLENLVRNAIEHGDEDVWIGVGVLDDRSGFYVEDDGPGIPEDEREKVFESGYSTAVDGTGFGLAIVEGIAGAHGWEIHVTDSGDGGARFEITGVEFVE